MKNSIETSLEIDTHLLVCLDILSVRCLVRTLPVQDKLQLREKHLRDDITKPYAFAACKHHRVRSARMLRARESEMIMRGMM